MTRNRRSTVEELAVDCIDVRELHRAGFLDRRYVPRWPEFRWPKIGRVRIDRYLIHIELRNQSPLSRSTFRGRAATSEAADPGCTAHTAIAGWLDCSKASAAIFVASVLARHDMKAKSETRRLGPICEPIDCASG